MITCLSQGCYLYQGAVVPEKDRPQGDKAEARKKTISYNILAAHNKSGSPEKLRISFDALISHDITFVGIIQTARASGLKAFPLPYALTNCHNSLCAVGGTINEDDHAFGYSAAFKYGGIYVPPNLAVIHQYAREAMAACGKMILGSDSHTRYGAYGCMGIGEGGGELVKQLLKNTYDIDPPETVLVYLEGAPGHGIGPQDVAIALVRAVFPDSFVKNRILEFTGPGLKNLSADFRAGIDVMTTETACLSSIWETDAIIENYYKTLGKPEAYRRLAPEDGAYYDRAVRIDLSKAEAMIALPFHPAKGYTIHEVQENPEDIFHAVEEECNRQIQEGPPLDLRGSIKNGRVVCDQGIIVGCSGGMYENIMEAAAILNGRSVGSGYFNLSVYPSSAPIALAVMQAGGTEKLMQAGAIIKPAFCGPCFGAGDTPAHNALSIRHATRNFASREGSKPGAGQSAAVALMDARSIAATAANGGALTAATDIDYESNNYRSYIHDGTIYEKRCYQGFGKPDSSSPLKLGPGIRDWPEIPPLGEHLLLKLCAVIHDEVTTTDELIPSGETSSYRSDPLRLAEFTLSRRCPDYVNKAKEVQAMEAKRREGSLVMALQNAPPEDQICTDDVLIGSCIFARKPGDGSAREQAASCQKVLGGCANISYEYATKRYRSNLINWGIIPFTIGKDQLFPWKEGDSLFIPNIRRALEEGQPSVTAQIGDQIAEKVTLYFGELTEKERRILLEGCLMNYYKNGYQD